MSKRYRPQLTQGSSDGKSLPQDKAPRRGCIRPSSEGRTAKPFKEAQIRRKSRSIARLVQSSFARYAPISDFELKALTVGLAEEIRILFQKETR